MGCILLVMIQGLDVLFQWFSGPTMVLGFVVMLRIVGDIFLWVFFCGHVLSVGVFFYSRYVCLFVICVSYMVHVFVI